MIDEHGRNVRRTRIDDLVARILRGAQARALQDDGTEKNARHPEVLAGSASLEG
jgi:hypothetical protein